MFKNLIVSITTTTAILFSDQVCASSDDSWATVDEGYSSTYSEASDWSYDYSDSSDYSYYSDDYNDESGYDYNDRGSSRERKAGPYDHIIGTGVFGVTGAWFAWSACTRERERRAREEAARVARASGIETLVSSVEVIEDPGAPRRDLLKPIFFRGRI